MKKFLIIKTSSLGDIIQTFPAVNYLRHKFPEALIDWVVECPLSQLVAANPDVNNTITVDTRRWRQQLGQGNTWKTIGDFKQNLQKERYDAIFDLQGNIKSGLITYLARGQVKVGFGWKTVAEKPNVLFTHQRFNPDSGQNIREDYLDILKKFFQEALPFSPKGQKLKLSPEEQIALQRAQEKLSSSKSLVMVCPGSAWPNKQVSESTFIDFLHRLKKHADPLLVLVWGNQAEFEYVNGIHKEFPNNSVIMERLPLPALQNLMDGMDIILAMDSLPLHLAGTTKTATFSLFGPSLAQKYKPQGKQHVALQGPCPYARRFEKRCPELRSCKTGACLKSLSGETLFDFFVQNQYTKLN